MTSIVEKVDFEPENSTVSTLMIVRGTQCHGLVDKVVFGQRCGLMILDIFSNLNYAVILLKKDEVSSKPSPEFSVPMEKGSE